MSVLQGYDPVIANAVLRNLSIDDIVLVMRRSNKPTEAYTLMLMGLRETCLIRLTNHTKI